MVLLEEFWIQRHPEELYICGTGDSMAAEKKNRIISKLVGAGKDHWGVFRCGEFNVFTYGPIWPLVDEGLQDNICVYWAFYWGVEDDVISVQK